MGYLELSWSYLRPSWMLQCLAKRPVQTQGGPSPKGKKGVGRESALNHLRPEGWWHSSDIRALFVNNVKCTNTVDIEENFVLVCSCKVPSENDTGVCAVPIM